MNGMPESIDLDTAITTIVDEKLTVCKVPPAAGKSLMLADLLDKKETPVMNGVLGKELRIGEKGLELVENHIERAINKTLSVSGSVGGSGVQNGVCDVSRTSGTEPCVVGVKRPSVNSEVTVNASPPPMKINKVDETGVTAVAAATPSDACLNNCEYLVRLCEIVINGTPWQPFYKQCNYEWLPITTTDNHLRR